MATALIVDDAKVMRVNIRNMLEKLGHEVVGEAENGYQGIKKYEECLPDFVTMDITMPPDGPTGNVISDGIDSVKGIKDFHPAAKIIMVTSHGEQDKVIKAIQAGASNYILKPIEVEKLGEVINKVLAHK